MCDQAVHPWRELSRDPDVHGLADHTPAYATPDLTTCKSEPVHVPGAIQPHGMLLAINHDHRVVMASGNCAALLGIPGGPVGMHLPDVLGAAPASLVPQALADGDILAPLRTTLPPGDGTLAGAPVDLVIHRSGARIVVEVEPVSDPVPTQHVSYRSARAAITRLTQSPSVPELCDQLASEIRRITGFDRVMVYRFDEEWNGEVVAEQRRDDLNPFLGLHYPSTDIPAQARRFYTVNWTRLIADIGYTPVPLEPVLDPDTAAPLDLSHSVLRSVSPIHVEYLSNMGVSASMSVLMVKDGALWGLVACHHYSGPRRVSYDARSVADFLGQTASQLVDDRERADSRTDELLASASLSHITNDLTSDPRPVYDTMMADARLLDLVGATGVVLWVEGRLTTLGDVPAQHVIQRIAARLGATAPHGQAVGSHHLAALDPELAESSDVAAGALYIGNGADRRMMWLRPELQRTVAWGGDPYNKALAAAEDTSVRLSPRKSFEKWQEVVRGCSAPWVPRQLSTVQALRAHLAAEQVRRSHQHTALAESLQRTLVLDEAPAVEGLDVHARYRPAEGSQLGGD